MSDKRPYFRSSIDELEQLFNFYNDNEKILKALRKELKHRTRPRAKDLLKKVEVELAKPKQMLLPIEIKENIKDKDDKIESSPLKEVEVKSESNNQKSEINEADMSQNKNDEKKLNFFETLKHFFGF